MFSKFIENLRVNFVTNIKSLDLNSTIKYITSKGKLLLKTESIFIIVKHAGTPVRYTNYYN